MPLFASTVARACRKRPRLCLLRAQNLHRPNMPSLRNGTPCPIFINPLAAPPHLLGRPNQSRKQLLEFRAQLLQLQKPEVRERPPRFQCLKRTVPQALQHPRFAGGTELSSEYFCCCLWARLEPAAGTGGRIAPRPRNPRHRLSPVLLYQRQTLRLHHQRLHRQIPPVG